MLLFTVRTRDVEPYVIVGGNPGRIIRKRFEEADIVMLCELRWWDWIDAQLSEAMPILTSGNVAALHDHWRRNIKVNR